MTPPLDLDYTLVFPKSRFREVVDALRPLCTSDTESALAGLLGPAPVEVVVAFRSWPDMPAARVNGFPKIDSHVRRLGDITIGRSRASVRPGPSDPRRGLVSPTTRRESATGPPPGVSQSHPPSPRRVLGRLVPHSAISNSIWLLVI